MEHIKYFMTKMEKRCDVGKTIYADKTVFNGCEITCNYVPGGRL